MSETLRIRLATAADIRAIAAMSRDLIETGLGWSWTPGRVARAVHGKESVAAVAALGPRPTGFAIMRFGWEEANLDLLAVRPGHRRRGVGRGLVRWLEESALVAGIGIVRLQVRADRPGAQAFYRSLGYRQWQRVAGYYGNDCTAVYMAHDLWCPPIADGVNPI
ncbi:MAG TPA: GNAT family N-acetyltransferase [Gammaproteobacteria bacterium]|nr:GNAT family N-acetyltransferase [Gammaproteobacteria bacterium]